MEILFAIAFAALIGWLFYQLFFKKDAAVLPTYNEGKWIHDEVQFSTAPTEVKFTGTLELEPSAPAEEPAPAPAAATKPRKPRKAAVPKATTEPKKASKPVLLNEGSIPSSNSTFVSSTSSLYDPIPILATAAVLSVVADQSPAQETVRYEGNDTGYSAPSEPSYSAPDTSSSYSSDTGSSFDSGSSVSSDTGGGGGW